MSYSHLRHFLTPAEAEIFELVPTPVWFFDVKRYGFWWCNSATLKMWGVDRVQDMVNKDLSGDSDGAKRRVWQTFEMAAAQGERGETWTTYPNNVPKVTYMRHRAILLGEERHEGIIAFVSDDVDLGKMPENILLIEAMRYISTPITVFSMEGDLMRQNEVTGDIYAARREEDVADPDPLFIRRFQDRATGRDRLERAQEREGSREEAVMVTKNGLRRHMVDVRVSRDPLSGDFNLVVTEEDVTDLRQAVEKAEAASKAKSDFLAVMSHELRTPLNGILGFTETLMDEGLAEEHQKMLQHIRESGVGLLDILNDILDLSKVEAGAMELDEGSIDLGRLLHRVASFWRPTINAKGLDFSLELPDSPLPIVCGDALRLRQILNNLLGNALKFTEIGTITLSLTPAEGGSHPHGFTFSITDSGVGIAPEDQPLLFTRFAQADGSATRRFGGTGLGLAICKELVELMGGEISLTSAVGKGTCVEFRLGFEAGQATAVEPETWGKDTGSLCLPDRRLRILLAEDNLINQRLLNAFLGHLNAELVFVGDGVEAVAQARSQSFDMILMDSQMPRLDGVGATAQIRDLEGPAADTPIIMLTADAMLGARERYLEAGLNDYVAKPIERYLLLDAIARALSGQTA